MAWAGETISISLAKHKDGSECYPLTWRSSLDPEQPEQKGAGGGAISYDGKAMLLAANTLLNHNMYSQMFLWPALDSEERWIYNNSDDDDGDDNGDGDGDDTNTEFIEATRLGSISDANECKASDLGNPASPKSVSEDDGNPQRQSSIISMEEDISVEVRLIGKAMPTIQDDELNYTILELDLVPDSISLFNNAIPLDDLGQIEPGPRNTAVVTVTPNAGVIHGVLSEYTHIFYYPGLENTIDVYTAEFFGPMGIGDGGCWVRDAATGCLFGHVIGGYPTSITNTTKAVIMPAKRVFKHALAKLQERKLKDQLCEVQADIEERILPKAGSAGAFGDE